VLRVDPLRNPEPLIRRVYGYVAYRIGDGPDAEDITSETFERALRYQKSFDPQKGEPLAWQLAIEVPDRADAGDLEDDTLRRLALSGAVARLEPRDRDLIALRYGADLTARQIAEELDLRTNAVEVALHRALGRLRETIGEPGDPPVRKQGTGR
jgi:RNA polymerase sigma-70 factor (ECF subfamily)